MIIRRSSGSTTYLDVLCWAVFLFFGLYSSEATPTVSTYYQITQLTTSNIRIWNASAQIGRHYGAASLVLNGDNNILYGGSTDLVSTVNRNQLDNIIGSIAGAGRVVLVNDLQSKEVFALRDEEGQRLTEPGFVKYLEKVSPAWNPLPPQLKSIENITLSEVLWLGYTSLICSGRGEAVLVDGDSGTAYLVNLQTGLVVQFANTLSVWQLSQGWVSYGIVEYLSSNQYSVVYGNIYGVIERQRLTTFHERENVTSLRFNHLSSLSIDWTNDRWYFYFRGNSLISTSFPLTIGYADLTAKQGIATSNPTTSPTHSPSRLPTGVPTFTPSTTPIAPVLLFLSSIASSSSITLTFALQGQTTVPGTVYCASMESISTTVSADGIQEYGSFANYNAYATNISVVVENLVPLSSPQIYCAVVTASGLVSSPGDIQSSQTISNTTCCKNVKFTSLPSMIYSDVTRYKSRSKAGYTANYNLDYSPSREVIVKPLILDANNNVVPESIIKCLPSTRTFLAKTKGLESNFIILASSGLLSGEFIVTFEVSGSGASEYEIQHQHIRMVGSNEEPLTPNLANVIFSDSGTLIYFYFDYDTNLAGLSLLMPWSCDLVFNFAGSELVTCTWLNKTTIMGKITFGVNDTNLAVVNDIVSVLPRKVQASCAVENGAECQTYRFSNSSKVVEIRNPVSPIIPTVILQYSSTLGLCQDLIIDSQLSTGNAGRMWKDVQWTVESSNSVTANMLIKARLDAYGRDIAQDIVIPRTAFTEGNYSITLVVQNIFDKVASMTIKFAVLGDPYLPKVAILGNSDIRIAASNPLTLYSRALFPKCFNSSNELLLQYSWVLFEYQSGQKIVNITNVSRNPAVYMLESYSLAVRSVYDLHLNVTVWNQSQLLSSQLTQARISTESGKLSAVIAGGAVVQLPVDRQLTLDGTMSFDEETLSTTSLQYQWNCAISSNEAYGELCNDVFIDDRSESTVTIAGDRLNAVRSYMISLQLFTIDGRSDTTFIDLYPVEPQSAIVSVYSAASKFNLDSTFVIQGYAQSNLSNVRLAWKAFVSENPYSFTSQSPLVKTIDRITASQGYFYPLVVLGSSFVPGSRITFRLQGMVSKSSVLESYSEVEIVANAAPYGGKLLVTPDSGFELTSNFKLQSIMWIDDPEDYPLTFSFQYKLYEDQYPLAIQGESTTSSSSTLLPSGQSSSDYILILTTTVRDRYTASNEASNTVAVLPSKMSTEDYLKDSLREAFSSHNVDQALQTLSNVVNIYNKVDCSLLTASFCQSKNRKPCSNMPNTCGACFIGYIGDIGSANSPCYLSSINRRVTNRTSQDVQICSQNSECASKVCKQGYCVDQVKQCPTTTLQSCSGKGKCIYKDANGKPISKPCSSSDIYCQAVCSCEIGYGGQDCSLPLEELLKRDAGRSQLCGSLQAILNISNPSPEFLQTFASALAQIYQPAELINATSILFCQTTLSALPSLITSDILMVSSLEVKTIALQAISKFIIPGAMENFTLDQLLVAFVNEYLPTISVGQYPVNITSDNVKLSIQKTSSTDLLNTAVSSPVSSEEVNQGIQSSSIEFSSSANLELCTNDDGIAEISLAQFNANPLSGVFDIDSPLLRWTLFSAKDVNMTQSEMSKLANLTSKSVAYYLNLQFISEQSFDFSYSPEEAKRFNIGNFTFPECSSFDGDDFKTCGGCILSTYTNHNVTYACYDASQICGLFVEEPISIVSNSTDGNITESIRRKLAHKTLKTRTSQFTSFVTTLQSNVVYILSTNPFHVDLEEAKAIISFIGIFTLILFAAGLFFFRWDQFDRNQFIYSNRWPPKLSAVNATLPLLRKKKSKYLKELEEQQYKDEDEGYEEEVEANKPGGIKSMFSMSMSLDASDDHQRGSRRYLTSPSGSVSTKSASSPQRQKSMRRQLSHRAKSSRKKLIFQQKLFSSNVEGFFDLVMPGILQHNYFVSYFHALLIKHDFTTPIIHPSTSSGRFYRWLSICKSLLVGLFVDTLFFQIFYANDGSCEQHVDRESCLLGIHSITLEKVCAWSASTTCATAAYSLSGGNSCTTITTCSLAPPPTTVYFTLFLAASTLLLCIPIEIVISYLLDQYCAKRPNLELIGINSGYWLGGWIGYQDRLDSKEMHAQSKLADIFAAAEKQALRSYPQNEGMKKLLEEIMLRTSDRVYRDYQTAEEELRKLLSEVKDHFEEGRAKYLPLSSIEQDAWKEAHEARTEAILQELGIRSDGSYIPLSWRERLFYFKHPRNRLIAKLLLARRQSDIIGERVEIIGPMSKHLQEVTLLNHFVLEQFSSFKQWILNDQFYCFGDLRPSLIDPIDWMAAWAVVILFLVFFIYWILAWGIRNGDKVLYHWGLNFIISTIQDIFLIQVGKIFIIHLILIVSIRPQLAAIQLHLRSTAIDYIQGMVPLRKQIRLHDFSIIHYISPVCRLSWKESCDELAMGRVLRQLDDLDIKKCHLYPKKSLGWISLFVFMLPGIVVLFGGKVAEIVVEVILPMIAGAVLLLHVELYHISIFALLIPYVLLILVFMHYCGFTHLAWSWSKRLRIRMKGSYIKSANNVSSHSNGGIREMNIPFSGNGVNPVVLMLLAERRKNSSLSKDIQNVVKDSLRFLWQLGDRHSKAVNKHEQVLWYLVNLPNKLQVQTSDYEYSSHPTGKHGISSNVFFTLIHQQQIKEMQPFQTLWTKGPQDIVERSPGEPVDAARQHIPLTCFSYDPAYNMEAADGDRNRSPTKLVKYMLFKQGKITSENQLMTLLRNKEVEAHQVAVHIPPAILALRNSKWYEMIEGNGEIFHNYAELLLQKHFLHTPTDQDLYREKIIPRERAVESEDIREDVARNAEHEVEKDSISEEGYSDAESFDSFMLDRQYSMQVPFSKIPKFTPVSRRQFIDSEHHQQQPTLAMQYIDRYQVCRPKIEEGVRQLLAVYMHVFNPLKDEFFIQPTLDSSSSAVSMSFALSASHDSYQPQMLQSEIKFEEDGDEIVKYQQPLKRKTSYDLSEFLLREELTIEALASKCKDSLLTMEQGCVLLKNVFQSFSPIVSSSDKQTVSLTKRQVTDFIASFCVWIAIQDTTTYTSKALRELQAWNASRYREEDIFDTKTEAGRRYALLLRDSPTHNARKCFPFHMLQSFFEKHCYELMANHRWKRRDLLRKMSTRKFSKRINQSHNVLPSSAIGPSNGKGNGNNATVPPWNRSVHFYDTVFDFYVDPAQQVNGEEGEEDDHSSVDDEGLDAEFYGYFHQT